MILILGGTSESIIIANMIRKISTGLVLSTATEYGKEVARKNFEGSIICGKKDESELKTYCINNNIGLIVDATHPYAKLVSENAISISKSLGIKYIRYERPLIKKDEEKYVYCYSYEEAGKMINRLQGNVLITTGSKDIEHILQEIKDKNRAFIRILPQSGNIEKLEKLNVLPDQIIAMKGPFAKDLNIAMLKNYNCKILVTKESGSQGMLEEKLQAAEDCNAKVIIIGRPKIDYPKVFIDIDNLINYINDIT
ncbi:precorrin-6x reductase [Vallitalea longa]|uniref:Precorrin-6x reductase n=1 Tax=Vallitalea longa TaxID=2936439 RepID=A0A9W5YEZ1_9FIRM|nr:precorrin-6A reductase [Vallitalea longa]GKX31280.1 precorrin-6x reductase [Vallitalea longa]